MEIKTAMDFAGKVKALKHCNKVLMEINRRGSAIVALNCTGVKFVVTKNDAMYFSLVETQSKLKSEISALELVQSQSYVHRNMPAPVGASVLEEDEAEEIRREQQKEKARQYSREYYKKNKEKVLAHQKEYYKKLREFQKNHVTTD